VLSILVYPNNRGVVGPRNAKAAPFLRQPSATLSAHRQHEDTCSPKVKGLRVYDEFLSLNSASIVPSTVLGLAIAEGRLSTLSIIAAITVISSIAAVPVMFTGFGRRVIAVPVSPLV
jgi:hypothetical protein